MTGWAWAQRDGRRKSRHVRCCYVTYFYTISSENFKKLNVQLVQVYAFVRLSLWIGFFYLKLSEVEMSAIAKKNKFMCDRIYCLDWAEKKRQKICDMKTQTPKNSYNYYIYIYEHMRTTYFLYSFYAFIESLVRIYINFDTSNSKDPQYVSKHCVISFFSEFSWKLCANVK